jgi:hypothetical protein
MFLLISPKDEFAHLKTLEYSKTQIKTLIFNPNTKHQFITLILNPKRKTLI